MMLAGIFNDFAYPDRIGLFSRATRSRAALGGDARAVRFPDRPFSRISHTGYSAGRESTRKPEPGGPIRAGARRQRVVAGSARASAADRNGVAAAAVPRRAKPSLPLAAHTFDRRREASRHTRSDRVRD